MNLIKKFAVFLLALVGVALIAAWLVLSSSLLSKPRGDMTARFLSQQLGQTVEIQGGVSIGLGTTLGITADQLVLPGAPGAEEGLAEIGKLSFDVALSDLLNKKVKLANLKVDGTKLRLSVAKDGTTSWAFLGKTDAKPDANPAEDTGSQNVGFDEGEKLLDFFSDHRVEFTNSELSFQDAKNGWDIDFVLASFVVSQDQGAAAPVILKGQGNVNGQELTIDGSFPERQPFSASIAFSDFSIKLDGTPSGDPTSTDFTSALVVDVTDLGQIQHMLKLKKSAFGTAQAKATLARTNGITTLSDVDALIAFSGGQSVKLDGSLGDLRRKDDTVMRTNVQLYNKDTMPPRAKIRQDLKLTGVDMTIDMVPGETIQRSMIIETNGFDINTYGEGPPPITVSDISRTPDGLLRLGKAELRLGAADAPFLILDGTIDDTLKLEQIDLGATLDFPMSNLVAPEYLKSAKELGQITGTFNLQGTAKVLALTDLQAASTNTDLWNLTVNGSVENALKFGNVDLDVAVDVPSGGDLMIALQLDPVDTGKVALATQITSEGRIW
ncbi:MAG: AsmA family protein, partial [Marinosulfonomonas sp.]